MSDGHPVPDHLLVPILEVAADTLRALDSAEVPAGLRHLHGFDRRGLMHGPAPRQLRRALAQEVAFAEQVRDHFAALPQVTSLCDRWSVGDPVEIVDEAAGRNDLALLASVLWTCEPGGAAFGLGLVVERDAQERRERGDEQTARARGRELSELEEARRRADAARMTAEAEAARAADTLRDERHARREREERAEADAQGAMRRADAIARQLEHAQAETEEERGRTAREAARARALEADLARTRSELQAAVARLEHAQTRLDERDARALADAAATAHQLASSLDAVRRRAQTGGRSQGAPAPEPEREREREREKPLSRRVTPNVPSGLVAESADGVDAMLRTPGALLVVDGYNVSKRAWPDAAAADQRERLGIAVTALSRRVGCEVLLVFDGDGMGHRPSLRRGGVRVVFSDADEEADEVVVREVAGQPKRVPVVVASSDAWVRQHAEVEGAVVVGADSLLGVLKPAR